MTIRTKFGSCFLVMALGTIIPVVCEAQQNRTAITPQRVAVAMAEAGWKVSAGQIKLLSQVTAIAGEAWLQVVQVTHWQAGKLKVELRCHDPRACLPFYVLVEQNNVADNAGALSTPDAAADIDAAAKVPALETTTEKPLMRSGDSAVLRFADKGLSITMPVVCLQSGRQGQTIRVASADHKRFYKAEIVGPGLLKATAL